MPKEYSLSELTDIVAEQVSIGDAVGSQILLRITPSNELEILQLDENQTESASTVRISVLDFVSATGGGSVKLQAVPGFSGTLELNLPIADGINGQALTTDGLGNLTFADTSTVASLDDLTDVETATPNDGQVLTYNGTLTQWEPDDLATTAYLPVGTMLPYGGSVAPVGFLVCDGSEVSKSAYPVLFDAIGDIYGTPVTGTNFVLPDARGRTLIGSGTGDGLTARQIGDIIGAEVHQLTVDEMPRHNHELSLQSGAATSANSALANSGDEVDVIQTGETGNDAPHNNMQPSLVINWIIYAGGTLPENNQPTVRVVTSNDTITTVDQIVVIEPVSDTSIGLPAVAPSGQKYTIKRSFTIGEEFDVSINGNGSDTIDGNTNVGFLPGNSINIVSTGTTWVIV